MEWLRQLVGLPPTFSGVIQDTASTATLVALLCARERTTGHGQDRGGLQAEPTPLVVYASEMAHSSIEKAALLAGFGRENLRLLPTDDAHALIPDALEDALRDDAARGHRPSAIVATVGSTGTTAIDPVARDRRARPRARRLAPRRRRHGWHCHGLSRAALDVGGGRAGRLGGVEPAQVARHRLRLHRLPRARPGPPGAGSWPRTRATCAPLRMAR